MKNEKRLIDANALTEKMEYTSTDVCADYGDGFCLHGYSTPLLRLMVSETPTVDAVKVVHGRWERESVPVKNMDVVRYRDTCSICGKKVDFLWRDSHYNYCPNCGAKMDGDGNG